MAPEADEEHRPAAAGGPAGRSVFDDPAPRPGRRRVLDGAAFGLYEDDEPEHRPPVVALAVVGLMAVSVAGLVWWAVRSDDDLVLPVDEPTTTTTVEVANGPPSIAELLLLVPPALEDCQPVDDPGTGGPPRAIVRCPGPDGLDGVELSLYPSVLDRDDAFDFVAGVLGAAGDDGECALGHFGRHDYIGVERVGQLACGSTGGRTDLVWTTDAGPVLALASSDRGYATAYRAWAGLVERTDDTFPIRPERALLDQLPPSLLDGCQRDVDTALGTGATLVVTCRPELAPAEAVMWLRFPDRAASARWFDTRTAGVPGPLAQGPEACTPEGDAGPDESIDEAPEPTAEASPPGAGARPYELDGSAGTVLCHVDDAGRPTVVWRRDRDHIGSVAVGAPGVSMAELLGWWEAGGHLP